MDRKQFIKNCTGGLCSCAAFGLMVPLSSVAAETNPKDDDWRINFIQKRYTKLFDILSDKLSDEELSETLHELGGYCAGSGGLLQKHKGDIDGFIAEFNRVTGENISYDPDEGIITVIGKERAECFCPMIDKNTVTKKICACSLGWQEYTYETLLGKKVKAELTESIVRGSSRCSFQIRVLG